MFRRTNSPYSKREVEKALTRYEAGFYQIISDDRTSEDERHYALIVLGWMHYQKSGKIIEKCKSNGDRPQPDQVRAILEEFSSDDVRVFYDKAEETIRKVADFEQIAINESLKRIQKSFWKPFMINILASFVGPLIAFGLLWLLAQDGIVDVLASTLEHLATLIPNSELQPVPETTSEFN